MGLDAKDSSFVQGTVTREQGHFTLPLRHNGSYLLKTSAVGYKTRYIPFSITDTETAKLSRILMEEDSYALSGITVTAQKGPVEMKAEKTVYNLSATISGTQGNLYDALRQMPGVQIQSNGNILLDGQGGINVLMNGKTTYLSGETLINYALSSIPGDKLHRVVVVTQYPQVAALAEKYSFTPLHNPYPERGQSESIRIGLAALSDCDAVMFQVADQPRLKKETVADLIGFAAAHPDRIVGLGHRGRRGNPCIFPARFFPELMALTGDCGGRSVILAHEGELLLMEVSPTQLIDIDSPEQLEKL